MTKNGEKDKISNGTGYDIFTKSTQDERICCSCRCVTFWTHDRVFWLVSDRLQVLDKKTRVFF